MGNVKQLQLKTEDLEEIVSVQKYYIEYLQDIIEAQKDIKYLSYEEYVNICMRKIKEKEA